MEFDALEGMLKFFNFGEHFIRLIKVLYNEFQQCICNMDLQVNGFIQYEGYTKG